MKPKINWEALGPVLFTIILTVLMAIAAHFMNK